MMVMPWPYVMSRILGLLSLVLLVTGLWFVIDWVETDLQSTFWLVVGLVLLGGALFGRKFVLMGFRREAAPGRPKADFAETIVGSGGSRLYVECFGAREANPVVLTCGWGFDRSIWTGVIDDLKKEFFVLVWDPPGVGRSGRPFDNHYSIERFAGDLRAVLAVTDGRPALLVGHGLGAMAVLELCRRRPPKGIAGAAILNAAASPLQTIGGPEATHRLRPLLGSLLKLDVWLSPVVQAASWASYMNGTALLTARSAAFGADPPREAVDLAAFVSAGQSPSVQAKALTAALEAAAEDPAEVCGPLLVIAGGRDALVGVEACRRTAEAAPEGKLVVVEAAGHAGPLEAPGAYAAAVADHGRTAFRRSDARRAAAESMRAKAKRFAMAPEPKSWVAAPETDAAPDDRAPDRRDDAGEADPPPSPRPA
jgi:pimeloyl-ACP methyl ester carboxylesterase